MRILTQSEAGKIRNSIKNEFGLDIPVAMIGDIQATYNELFQRGIVGEYRGEQQERARIAIDIANTLVPDDQVWKGNSFRVMETLKNLVSKGEIDPDTLYFQAVVMEELEQQERKSQFQDVVSNITDTLTTAVEPITETQKKLFETYKPYIIGGTALALIGGGLFAYIYFTGKK